MPTDQPLNTATVEDAAFILEDWDRRTRAHDIDGLLDLYLPDAVLESPLIPRVLDQLSGVLTGHEQMRPFFRLAPTTARTSWCGGTALATTSSTGGP